MQRVIPFLRKAMRSSESPAVGNIRYFELKKPKKMTVALSVKKRFIVTSNSSRSSGSSDA